MHTMKPRVLCSDVHFVEGVRRSYFKLAVGPDYVAPEGVSITSDQSVIVDGAPARLVELYVDSRRVDLVLSDAHAPSGVVHPTQHEEAAEQLHLDGHGELDAPTFDTSPSKPADVDAK